MPIHDWTRVTAGTWHDFHVAWTVELRNAVNGGILTDAFYSQVERVEPETTRRVVVVRRSTDNAIAAEIEILAPGDAAEISVAISATSGPRKVAHIEPTAVGRPLIDMPLFLTPDAHVNVPLEPTYQAAFRGVPRRWRDVLVA